MKQKKSNLKKVIFLIINLVLLIALLWGTPFLYFHVLAIAMIAQSYIPLIIFIVLWLVVIIILIKNIHNCTKRTEKPNNANSKKIGIFYNIVGFILLLLPSPFMLSLLESSVKEYHLRGTGLTDIAIFVLVILWLILLITSFKNIFIFIKSKGK